ncbi:MAG: TolC family protein [Psychrilyobacter sp.]|uniref:TolC family protein n=1 Tax=Psychrilyobacter sp. TaxID=2586924 RepID=UPI003C72BBDF
MKKYVVLFFILIFSSSFSQEYSIDDLILKLKKNGPENKYKDLDLKKIEIQEKEARLTDRDGILFKAIPSHSNDIKRKYKKDYGEISGSYDFLTLGVNYDSNAKYDPNPFIGVNKDLKDLFYSQRSHKMSLSKLNSKKERNNIDTNLNKSVISLIDSYKEYRNMEEILDFYKTQNKLYKDEFNNISKRYELGDATKLEWELVNLKYQNLIDSLKVLSKNINNKRLDFKKLYNIHITKDDTLTNLVDTNDNINNLINNLRTNDLENINFDKKIAQENFDYSEYNDKVPNLKFSTNYNLESEDWLISLELTKLLFSENSDSKINKIQLKELNLREIDLKKQIDSEKQFSLIEIENLQTKRNNLRKKLKVKKLEFLIDKKKFELGKKEFTDYIESRENYENTFIEYDKSQNELAAFIYKLEYQN